MNPQERTTAAAAAHQIQDYPPPLPPTTSQPPREVDLDSAVDVVAQLFYYIKVH